MTHILVLQWPGSTEADFEELLEMEDALESRIGGLGAVDGHDFGAGEMNLFVKTEQPVEAFSAVKEILGGRPSWAYLRAAFRETSGEKYDVLWPPGLTDFSVK